LSKDLALIKTIAENNPSAFRELYELYSEKVYNTAISYAKNTQEAEEITQDVFVKIHKYAAKFKGDSEVSTWIYRITVNTSLNFLKKKKRWSIFQSQADHTEKIEFEHPGVLMEKKEDAKILMRLLSTLPETQQTAFILSYIEDLPRQKVADIMEVSLKSVESLLQRAKQNLRTRIKKSTLREGF
jgi:RNA polymerase sigma-70 factor (ECF subfamily)